MGWIILWPIITFVAIAVGYSQSSRWCNSQCMVTAAGAAKPRVSLWVLPRENAALSSCLCQPEVCSAPRSAHSSTQPEESSSLFMFALGKGAQAKALAGLVKFGPFWECVLGTTSGDWWKFIFCMEKCPGRGWQHSSGSGSWYGSFGDLNQLLLRKTQKILQCPGKLPVGGFLLNLHQR